MVFLKINEVISELPDKEVHVSDAKLICVILREIRSECNEATFSVRSQLNYNMNGVQSATRDMDVNDDLLKSNGNSYGTTLAAMSNDLKNDK